MHDLAHALPVLPMRTIRPVGWQGNRRARRIDLLNWDSPT
jgi:hypothetical protein